MHASIRTLLLLLTVALLFPAARTEARDGTIVKHTVSGSGVFEQGRSVRAEVNRATFHPIDHNFALSVFGRMGWVITGYWQRDGDELVLQVKNMNNMPARGSGEVKLDSRGQIQMVNLSGSTRGGAYRVRFKTGALTASNVPPVRMGPGRSYPSASTGPLKPFSGTPTYDRSRRGSGEMRIAGTAPIEITSAEVQIVSPGRVIVRASSAANAFRFEGTAGTSGSREEFDLVLHASSGGSGVITGTAVMDRSGQAVEDLELRGWIYGRSFSLEFEADR
jgi:hypothetical protein